jgi:hypothetical protein
MALVDHACGHYEVQTYGYPGPSRREYRAILKERYGVRLNAVADCTVTPDLEWYVDGYNTVSCHLLIKKYEKDIFEECAVEAHSRWEEERAEMEAEPGENK